MKAAQLCNVHPLFRQALAPYAPKPIPMRPFVVTIRTGAKPEELNVLAASSCDAIVKAMELFFDDDGVVPPEGLTLCARQYHVALHHRLEASAAWPEFQPVTRNVKGNRHA